VARGLDSWLVGWLAVIVWIGGVVADRAGLTLGPNLTTTVYWTGAIITAAHFGLSYHLAYSEGAPALRKRPFALAVGPALLALTLVVLVAVSLAEGASSVARVTSALITSVYLMTTWHYIKQVYGVGRVGAAFGGVSLGPAAVRVLRFGLYPLWALGAAQVLVQGSGYRFAGFRVGFSLLPAHAIDALRIMAVAAAVPTAIVFAQLRRRTGMRLPSVLVAPYVAAFLWLGLAPNPVWTFLLLAPFHALQYLAVGHRAELAVAADRPGTHGVAWWLNVFVGAACGGLLLSRWLPQMLDAHLGTGGGTLLFAAAFFVFLNLHHYLIDAVIWRSSGELVKAMVRKPAPAVVVAEASAS
jgi:hypothetical protein